MRFRHAAIALLMTFLTLGAGVACSSDDPQTGLLTTGQMNDIRAQQEYNPGLKALLDAGYAPLRFTYDEEMGHRVVFTACSKRTNEDCERSVRPTNDHPFVSVRVIQKGPHLKEKLTEHYYLVFPAENYLPVQSLYCEQQPSVAFEPYVVQKFNAIGTYFNSQHARVPMNQRPEFTKKMEDGLTWHCEVHTRQ